MKNDQGGPQAEHPWVLVRSFPFLLEMANLPWTDPRVFRSLELPHVTAVRLWQDEVHLLVHRREVSDGARANGCSDAQTALAAALLHYPVAWQLRPFGPRDWLLAAKCAEVEASPHELSLAVALKSLRDLYAFRRSLPDNHAVAAPIAEDRAWGCTQVKVRERDAEGTLQTLEQLKVTGFELASLPWLEPPASKAQLLDRAFATCTDHLEGEPADEPQPGRDDTLRLMERLLEAGADVDALGSTGTTALVRACNRQDTELIRLLVKWNPSLDARDMHGRTLELITAGIEPIQSLLKAAAAAQAEGVSDRGEPNGPPASSDLRIHRTTCAPAALPAPAPVPSPTGPANVCNLS